MTGEALIPLYVILLNWNLPQDTIACIESIQQSHFQKMRVLVVDNGSTDNSVDLLRERFGNNIEIIENGTNLGFAAGVNVGINYALRAGVGSILLLNNDTIVAPDMMTRLLDASRCLPQAGLLGPVIYYHQAPTRVWRYGDKELRWLPIPLKMSEKELVRKSPSPFKVDYATACGLLIKREVIETVGLLDERYFMYFEDADFCRRVRQAGYEIWCVPEAKMWHKVSLSAEKDKPANRYSQAWGRAQFYQTHQSGLIYGFTNIYLILKIFQITVRDILYGDWDLIKPLWLGTWDGHRA